MRKAVCEYFELSEQEKAELWKTATFVFDTNVLLNLYRYTVNTRESLLGALEELKDRIWIPHHVAEEFMKDRCAVISDCNSAYEETKRLQKELVNKSAETLKLKTNDPEIIELRNVLNQWMASYEEHNPKIQNYSDDAVLARILSIFDGKVGEGFDEEEISSIEKEGSKRYANQTPPGYKDADKNKSGNNNVYGDLIIWKELLRFASNKEKDIIFITDDKKEDWWNIVKTKTIGPRVELRKEFFKETDNRRFHMYTMERFLSIFSDDKGKSIDSSVIEEIGMVAKEREQIGETSYSEIESQNAFDGGRIRELENQLVNLYDKNEKRMNAIKLIQGQIKRGAGNPEEKLFEIRNIEENVRRAEKEIERIEREIKILKTRREKRLILLDEELESIIG